jgi:hypothetical protein
MNDIVPTGFEIVYQDDFVINYRGVIRGRVVQIGKTTYRGSVDWTCIVDGVFIFGGERDTAARRKMVAWLESVK